MKKKIILSLLLISPTLFAKDSAFDLGGSCLKEDSFQEFKSKYSSSVIAEAEKNQKFDILIEEKKITVRNDCSVPARWQSLFELLVKAKKYDEAVRLLDEVKNRKITFPHIVIAKSNEAFLNSPTFKMSSAGIAFEKETAKINEAMKLARQNLSSMSEKEKPPQFYSADGACPFECCHYGKWKARESVPVYADTNRGKILFTIQQGANVEAKTGKVLREPEPYAVIEPDGLLKPGDVIFMLDYQGEGSFNYWYKGKLNPNLNSELNAGNLYEDNQSNNRDRRLIKKLFPDKVFKDEWWAAIQTTDGKTGWVLPDGNFDGTDACGH